MMNPPMIETDHLLLRTVNLDDANDMFIYLSDSEVIPFQKVESVHEEIE
ncbi:RimJ/RimL family protein N-acetyltransferase [Fictibacillus halophilus]|uniref:RimJ/RimL family protein N-acetyltransferase n=1 Tax=Fictibacillus halophilus TaxID=1610490 RepID=A0ABV2LID8_9BACL|nr:hypothetical protein [Fictibacillus halophilus]